MSRMCCRKRRVDKVFAKARSLTTQELNITSMIKAQRQSSAICEIVKHESDVINRHVKRHVLLENEQEEV